MILILNLARLPVCRDKRSMKTLKISALLVANQLDLKGIKAFLDLKPLADSSSELLYSFGNDRLQYYFNYGLIVFSGYSEDEIKAAVQTILPHRKNPNISGPRAH